MSNLLELLGAVMSADNQMRNAAEAALTQMTEGNPSSTAMALLEIMASQNDISIRSLAGILLRRALDKHGDNITSELNANIRQNLIQIWCSENNTVVLKRLSHVLAQSASNGDWHELLPSLISQHAVDHANTSNEHVNKIIALLKLIEIISEYAPDDIQRNLGCVGGFLASCMNSGTVVLSPKIEIACARTTCACVVVMSDDSARNSFKPALTSILRVLSDALNRSDEVDATSIIEYLVEIASIQPLFYKQVMDTMMTAMLTVAGSVPLDMSTRSMALEFILTVCEAAPALCRRNQTVIQGIIPLLFSMIFECSAEVTEEEWVKGKYADGETSGGGDSDDDFNSDGAIAEDGIERLASSLGGKTIGGPLMMAITQLLTSPDPIHRRAALVGCNRFCDGCSAMIIKTGEVGKILELLHKGIQDTQSPRVQYQALQGIGRCCTLFPNSIKDILRTFLPILVDFLGNPNSCSRIKGHSASALINLVNPTTIQNVDSDEEGVDSPIRILTSQLDGLVGALINCLQTASLEVQSPCLVVLGCIAQVVEEGFTPYYSSIMPGIKGILANASSVKSAAASARASISHNHTHPNAMQHTHANNAIAYMHLCGKAMECVGLIGEAVGSAVFSNDALEIIQLLLSAMDVDPSNTNTNISNSNDTITFDYILPACARIAKALGPHFEPYIPFVMNPLLQGANVDIQFTMEDVDDDEEADGGVTHDEDTNMDSTVINMGSGVKKRVTLNTHAVQQKQQAARLIFEYAGALKGFLKSYLSPCMQAVLSMVTDKHSSDTRASASMTIKPLYEAYIHAHTCPELKHVSQPEVQSVLVGCMDKLLVAIHGELNQDARACAVEALRDLLLVTYETGVEDPYSNRSQFLCHVTCGPPGTLENSANLMEQIIQQLLLCCSEAFDRRNEKVKAYATALLESSGANDIEEGDYDELLEEIESEEDVITVATDGLGQLLKLCGKTAFMPYFDQGIGPAFLPFLLSPQQGCQLPGSDGSTTSTALQIIATCLVDDILEYGYNEGDTPACALLNSSQLQSVLATFMNALSSKNLLLQQSSSYGISQLLCNYPSLFTVKTIYTELLPSYMKLLSNPQAKDDEHIGITENCIYGIGIVLTKYRTCLDNIMGANAGTTVNTNSAKQMIAMVTHWLQYLPLQADEKESKCSLIHLCELLEKTDALILSNDVNALNSGAHHKFENMEVIFNIFAKSILIYNKSGAHVVSPPTPEDGCFPMHILTFQRMVHILKQYIGVNGMGGGMPSELVQFYISKLKPEYQQVLITVANESV